MRTINSLGNRLVALALSLVLLVGMIPANVYADDGTSAYGTVEGLTSGVKIEKTGAEVKATYSGTLNWVAKDESIGRNQDGWWVGLKVIAPESINLETAQFTSSNQTRLFKEYNDSEDNAEVQWIGLWKYVNEEYLRSANQKEGVYEYTWTFDWDGDGIFEQKLVLEVDAGRTILLNDSGKQVFPASVGKGKVSGITDGSSVDVDGDTTTASYSNITLNWVAKDESIGRNQDGWWVGIKVTAPSELTKEADFANVTYQSHGKSGWSAAKSFWNAQDSDKTAEDTARYLSMWGLVSPEQIEKDEDKILKYRYRFDWNQDGLYEQTVVLAINAKKVTLTKEGVQVFPTLGQVSSDNGASIKDNGTGKVTVTVNDAELNWSPADESDNRTQGWWIGIQVAAPDGIDEDTLKKATYQSKGNPNTSWEDVTETKLFWECKDSKDTATSHHIGLWLELSKENLEKFKNEDRNITAVYRFDWDGKNGYEQEITFSVNPKGNIILKKADQTGFAFAVEEPEDIWVGDGTYQNVASGGQGDGAITYEIISGDAATIDAEGKLTFTKAGSVTVKATKAEDTEGWYNAASAQYKITAVRKDQSPVFYNEAPGAIIYEPGLTYENKVKDVLGGAVTYAIVDEDINGSGVATVDSTTGKLTVLKAGTVTVQAVAAGDVNYNSADVTYTLVIKKAEQTGFAFENAPAELIWQSETLSALALVNGKGNGAVSWEITEGADVAAVDAATGEITLLKTGTFTICAQKAGDDCYNDSAAISTTIQVKPAAQTDFGFGATNSATVTYNDNGNEYMLAATGGQSTEAVKYTVIDGDAASVHESTGVVTILKSGTVTIQATKPADDRYKEITATFELHIEKAEQSFTFGHDKQIAEKYGMTSFNTIVIPSEKNSGLVTYVTSGDAIGATVDASGVVSFGNSVDKVGSVAITATLGEDDCYKAFSDTYTITLGYEATPATPYTLQGDKLISTSPWFTGDVEIMASEGYQISYTNDLTDNQWKNAVIWDTDGEAGTWTAGFEPVVYLKNTATGAITDAISVPDLKRDTVKPNNLTISYDVSVLATIGEKIFGFHASDVKVTVSAEDSLSGIGKMEYSLDAGNTYTQIEPENEKYEFIVTSQHRGQLWIQATDAAGNSEVYKHLDNDIEKVLVVDHTEPGLTVGYACEAEDYAVNDIRYFKDKVTVAFEITDENFDLRAADPVVTVNGTAMDGWIFDATTGKLTFDLADNGDYVINAEFTDRLNRKVSYASEVRVDLIKPVIETDIVNGKYYTEKQDFVLTITEHNFDASKVELTVSAEDPILTADEIQAFAAFAKDPANWTTISGTDKHQLPLEIAKDGNYTVKVACNDILMQPADTYISAFTVDTVDPDQPVLTYEVGAAKSDLLIETILNGLFGFAKETTVVTVQSGDLTSGIDRLEYKLHDEDAYTVVSMDADGKYSFDLDPQYRGKITVVVYDKAGRYSETVEQKEIVVDDIAPEVEIAFTGERQDAVKADDDLYITRETMSVFDETTRFIYNSDLTATIKVSEANFFQENEDMTIQISRDGTVVSDWAAAGITDSGWILAEGVYTRTFVMTADGDYQLFAQYKDHSLNEMDWESKETAEYGNNGVYSYASNIHSVDKTAPVYEVAYDNDERIQTLDGRAYYDKVRTATIKITDRNFRPDEVVFRVAHTDVAGVDVVYDYSKLNSWSDWTNSGDTWSAVIPFGVDANYTVSCAYDDLANHKMANKDGVEEDYNLMFTVDTQAPTDLNVEYKSKDARFANKILNAITFGHHNADQEVVLTMADATAGIDYIALKVTAEGPASATDLDLPRNLLVNADGSVKSGRNGFVGPVRSSESNGELTLAFDVPAQFRGKIDFVAYDKSGNSSTSYEDPGVFVVDTIAPEHTISYNPSNVVKVSNMKDMSGFDAAEGIKDITSADASYVMYFSDDAVAKIQIAEANFDPAEVRIAVLDADGDPVSGWKQTDWVTTTKAGEADVHTKTVKISAEGDYRIKVYYQDHSMNTPVDYLSQWIVVDKTAPVIKVKYSNTNVKNTIENRKYFDAAQTATITVKEHNFRADDVVIKVSAKNVLGADVLTLNADGTVKTYANQGADRKRWTAYKAGTWRVKDDTYVITLNYSTDANYTFDIEYKDLAKNKAADYKQDLFTVDTTAPKNLTIDYSTNVLEKVKESITFGYYNAKMTVTISAQDDTSGIYHFDYSYIKGKNVSGVNAELLNQAIKEANITYDGKKATAKFSIPKAVLGSNNQFNGTVKFAAYDRSEGYTELKDNQVIVVDNIAPTAKVTYNAPVQNVNGVSYYDGDITANIAINEANFDAKDVVVTVTRNGENFPVNVSWKDNSVDNHIGTFTLSKDGDYVVSVQYKDKSGNQMAAYKSNVLTLDATMPSVKVSNIKANSANKSDKYGFVITVNDTKLDASSLKPVLKAVVQKEEGVYKTVDIDLGKAKTVVSGQTYTYTVEDLPEDGIYTLTCSVKDMSSNTMSQIILDDEKSYDQVQFSINRNGSTFGYGNEYSEELIGQYYVYSVNEDIVIEEVNVDPIEEYKVTLNGKELTEGSDYTTSQTSKNGEWSKRTYIIKKALFEAEGEYSIIVSSKDKAETTAFSDVKNLAMAFVVDQTKPALTITGLEAGGRYQTTEQNVTLIPTDEGGRLNSLVVLVLDADGNPLKDDNRTDISVRFDMAGEELLKYLEDNDGKVTFTIPEGLNNQIQIICNDCAVDASDLTNEYNELFEQITVSQNQFVIFYANTSAFVGTIVGVLGIIALIIFLIKRKKNKAAAKA